MTKPDRRKRNQLARPHGAWSGHRYKSIGTCSIRMLLRLVGIDIKPIRKPGERPCGKPDCPRRRKRYISFWKRKASEIYETLHNARRLYRERVKQLHPDRGGNGRQTAELTEAWRRLQRIFAQHGYHLDDGLPHHD